MHSINFEHVSKKKYDTHIKSTYFGLVRNSFLVVDCDNFFIKVPLKCLTLSMTKRIFLIYNHYNTILRTSQNWVLLKQGVQFKFLELT